MKMPFKIKNAFFRLRRRYLLALVNENSLAPVFSLSLRKSALLGLVLAALLLSGAVWYAMFRFTPMRNLLPARLDTTLRDNYMRLALRVDSLSEVAAVNGAFLGALDIVLSDSVPVGQIDTVSTNLYDLPLDSLMTAGKAEERFVKQFESSERFNLSVLSPIAAEGMIFYPPFAGIPLKSNATDKDMPSVTVNTVAALPVSAIFRGTVIDAYYTATNGITVVVQHPNNFISQYSGLGDIFVSRGGKVNAGQRIGITADERYPLTFMLWHDGTPLDPAEYIQLPDKHPIIESEPFLKTRKK